MSNHQDACDRRLAAANRRRLNGSASPIWTRWWFGVGTLSGGILALVWFLLRTGTKPSRFTYPCQQAAMGTAATAFGVPLAITGVALRGRLWATLRAPGARLALVTMVPLALALYGFASVDSMRTVAIQTPPPDHHPAIFLVNDARGILPGRYGGVDDLITLMGLRGIEWYRSATSGSVAGPDGLIDADDVVLIKINAQWAERGGTNTDVLRGVIRRVVEHPDGFGGEVVVADNGQGSGNMNRPLNNAEDQGQSPLDVVNDFAAEGWNVSQYLWDDLRNDAVGEYDSGDMSDGYVVASTLDPETQIKVSYPKFTTAGGAHVSYRYGVWSESAQDYDAGKLMVINMPVFKTHSIYAITASVKNHMGVVTQRLGTDSHNGVGRGGLGTIMAEIRRPDLTILDCTWILARPGYGPSAPYANATRRDQLVAGTDPVALDAWATRFIMIPQIVANGYEYEAYHDTQDPDNPDGVFRRYLDRSMNELLAAGIATTNDYRAAELLVWGGDLTRDGRVNLIDFVTFARCFGGAVTNPPPSCSAEDAQDSDLDDNGVIDLGDFASFAANFTG